MDVLDSGDAAHLAMMKRPDLGVTFTKLKCWTLTEYSKCVFMDSDTLVSVRSRCWLSLDFCDHVCHIVCSSVNRLCPT